MKNKILTLITLVVLFMAGGHLLDVGDIASNSDGIIKRLIEENNLNYIQQEGLTNGFFNIGTSKVYHIGYYLMYISFMALIVLYLNILFKKDNL